MVAPKKPLDNHGSIRIRFTHNGIRFTLGGLGEYRDETALMYAQTVCNKIALDIASGNFTATNNAELAIKYHPPAAYSYLKQAEEGIRESLKEIEELPFMKPTLIEKLEERLEHKFCTPDQALLNLLRRYNKPIETALDAKRLVDWLKQPREGKEKGITNRTLKRYLDTLQVISPYFKDIKITVEVRPMPKPFTVEEVKAIIRWFEENKSYSHYADYVKFLFWTGVRTSEAIGLQWKHVDFNRNLLLIYEALGRKAGSSSVRVRKPTKTNKKREFPLAHGLLEMLQKRYAHSDKNPEALVFPSPTGKALDDHNFNTRIWKKCLQELKVEHRPQYNTRHTFISHFIAKTNDVVKCASLTHGSKSGIQTIYNNYAGIINRVEVPDIY